MNTKTYIYEAKDAVSAAAYCPKKLTAIHAGIAAGAGLLVALLSYLLSTGIGGTGGLGGIGTRAALETAQSILELAIAILAPFWSLGFVAAALQFARRQQVGPHTLLTGFRCWGPALRLMLLEGLLCFAVILVTMQAGSYLYLLSPFSAPLTALLQQAEALGITNLTAMIDLIAAQDQQVLRSITLSSLIFLGIPPLVVLIPLAYRLRLAQYILVDRPRLGAMFALMLSFKLTKHQCRKLFALDLRFWWFYALEILVQILCYSDLLLPLLGLELGMNGVLASFLFYALALVCQTGLYVWKKPQVLTSYALFFDHLLPTEEGQAA